jgi:putative restriction endonuclease
MLTAATVTRLEKAAIDNGFDLDLGRTADWLLFGSSQTSLRVWLTAVDESLVVVAISRADVLDAVEVPGMAFGGQLPPGAAGARSVGEMAVVHRLLRRAFQLSRTLPDELLHEFEDETANLPRSTEAERLVIQRVGQDIFRRGLLEYWEGSCAISGLSITALLRASHIKPWGDCE